MRSRWWLLAIGAFLAMLNVVPAFASVGGVIWGS